jgi:hypothetical protein
MDSAAAGKTQRGMNADSSFTRSLEAYTAAVPSSAYLAVAAGAMAFSFACQVAGRGKWGNFLAQWVPTWMIIGIYNKLVKLHGHNITARPASDQSGGYVCEFCESRFSFKDDLKNHQEHCQLRTPSQLGVE